MKFFAPLVAILMTLYSCSEKADGYTINGHIDGMVNENIYLEFLSPTEATVVDTASVDENGDFVMKGKVVEKGIHKIRNEQGDKFWILLAENTKFVFNADYNDPKLRNVNILNYEEGANFQKAIDFYITEQESLQARAMELQKKVSELGGDQNAMMQVQQEYMGLENELTQTVKDKISSLKAENPYSAAYLLLIGAINPQKDAEYVSSTISDLIVSLPDNKLLLDYKEKIDQMTAQIKKQEEQQALADAKAKEFAQNTDAKEIVMKGIDGKEQKLSDLQGKVVLVDFWASWCKPCRAENPNVVRMYHQYKNKGFDIFSVSLDKNQAKWEQAIAKDGLVWKHHVSDLKGWQNAAAQAWGVTSIPATYLLDKDGKVIARNLRGAALEAKLKEVL